ncbi:MAG: hypothetical protein H6745_29185 [Deltaproteobacteria bacterium]|nr:hypothetical protein [Deltaproteobacteria bacterium]
MASSAAWRRFEASLGEAGPTDEIYDVAAFEALGESERQDALDALVERAEDGDGVAAQTLGVVGDDRVVHALEGIVARPDGARRAAMRALSRLGHGARFVPELVAELKQGGLYGSVNAVQQLGWIGTKEAFDGLLEALSARDSTVRSVAVDALLELTGLAASEKTASGDDDPRTPIGRLRLLLDADLAALATEAGAAFRDLFEKARGGADAKALDLVYDGGTDGFREAFGKALRDPSAALPLDLVRSATPHDRAWAEALLAVALQREDERAPAALAALDASWAVPALDEARQDAIEGFPFADALDDAMKALRAG